MGGWEMGEGPGVRCCFAERPEVLIHNGKLFEEVMAKAQLTHHELVSALRQAGCACIEEVHTAILENNGSITVTPRCAKHDPKTA